MSEHRKNKIEKLRSKVIQKATVKNSFWKITAIDNAVKIILYCHNIKRGRKIRIEIDYETTEELSLFNS